MSLFSKNIVGWIIGSLSMKLPCTLKRTFILHSHSFIGKRSITRTNIMPCSAESYKNISCLH